MALVLHIEQSFKEPQEAECEGVLCTFINPLLDINQKVNKQRTFPTTVAISRWGCGPGIADPGKITLRKRCLPVLRMLGPNGGTAKYRHPVDASSMFFAWDH